MSTAPNKCPRCGTREPCCCTASDDESPPWITLQFYDQPFIAYRMRNGLAEVREYNPGTGECDTVTLGRADVEELAAAFAKEGP